MRQHTTTADQRRGTPHRGHRRARATLVMLVAGTLVWASLAFLQSAGVAETNVQTVPGTSSDGIADVVDLDGEVTSARGVAQLQDGVKVARIDVASAYQQDMRVSVSWQNVTEFSQATVSNGWQIRYGIYYPVRTGACTDPTHPSDDDNHAVTITLSGEDETFGSGTTETYCAYRDATAAGSGVVTSGEHAGTQLLARDRLVGMLAPKKALAKQAGTCQAPGDGDADHLYCMPAGLDSDDHAYFIVASLVSPGSKVPPGQQGNLTELQTFIRVTPGTA